MVERMQPNDRFRPGFTLIELLVVLGIITALSGLALSYVDHLNTSQRRDRTRQQLDDLEILLHGDGKNPGVFLSDMGRLPIAREMETNADGEMAEVEVTKNASNSNTIVPTGKVLSELWDGDIFKYEYEILGKRVKRIPTPDLYYLGYNGEILTFLEEANGTVNAVESDCPYVFLECGWKGPYLNVQAGKNYFDGFGNEFRVNASTVNNLTELDVENWPENTILEVGSFGQNAEEDIDYSTEELTTTVSGEIEWHNRDDLRTLSESRIFATLILRILVRDASGNTVTWLPPEWIETTSVPEIYNPSGSYVPGAVVRPLPSYTEGEGEEASTHSTLGDCQESDLFLCVRQGEILGEAHPTWSRNTTVMDDSGNQWQWLPHTRKCTHLRAAVFSPAVETKIFSGDKKRTGIRATTALYPCDDTESTGTRKIWAIDVDDLITAEDRTTDFFMWYDPTKATPRIRQQALRVIENEPEVEGGEVTTEISGFTYAGDLANGISPTIMVSGYAPGEVCFTRLTPGVRKFFVYMYLHADDNSDNVIDEKEISQAVHSGVQTVELKPGVNFATVYLTETILPEY